MKLISKTDEYSIYEYPINSELYGHLSGKKVKMYKVPTETWAATPDEEE